jgi:hypothetical protein
MVAPVLGARKYLGLRHHLLQLLQAACCWSPLLASIHAEVFHIGLKVPVASSPRAPCPGVKVTTHLINDPLSANPCFPVCSIENAFLDLDSF